jgi:hypothetical protein
MSQRFKKYGPVIGTGNAELTRQASVNNNFREGRICAMGDKSPKDAAKKKTQKDAAKDKKKAPPVSSEPAKKK